MNASHHTHYTPEERDAAAACGCAACARKYGVPRRQRQYAVKEVLGAMTLASVGIAAGLYGGLKAVEWIAKHRETA